MKKYIAVLIILFIIGVILTFITFQQSKILDDEVYINTTASIRNLKLLDNNIDLLLFGIHYENKNSYDRLEDSSIELSEEFDNLRYEALLEEIESSSELQTANIQLEKALFEKEEMLSEFREHNQSLIDSKKILIDNYKRFLTETESENSEKELESIIKDPSPAVFEINKSMVIFYTYLSSTSDTNRGLLNASILQLKQSLLSQGENTKKNIESFINQLQKTTQLHDEAVKYFDLVQNSDTISNINALEEAYVNYHNRAIEESGNLRNALIVYGFVLLGFLLFLGYLLRNQYLSLEKKVAERTLEIRNAYTDLKESQEQLIQSEKMASLGEMVAGVAHEINTPLGYVNSNISTIKSNLTDVNDVITKIGLVYSEAIIKRRDDKKISKLLRRALVSYRDLYQDETIEENSQLLDDAEHGIDEISGLVVSLKDFSRLDRKAVAEVDVHDCIDNALKIATNIVRENEIAIEKQYGQIPLIVCTPSKLNQLFLNIITNASQAMKDRNGTLTIRSDQHDEFVVLSFSDEGIGMDPETLQKMFDPFFTSKPIGEGTGLGMSIAYKIVQEHKGKIDVQSTPGIGTEIKVFLPINENETTQDESPTTLTS